jgi:AraC family transcriptional regulator of adaptative response/methylated-DNA-[protein]-cysteine methyltransferase
MKLKVVVHNRKQKNKIDAIYYSSCITKFGKFLITSTDQGIYNILLFKKIEAALRELQTAFPQTIFIKKETLSHKSVKKYLSDQKTNPAITAILRGTEFQIRVWRALLTIAKGKTITYAKIAKQIDRPKAVRAVGTAIGNNPICYLIPCHRVLSSDGSIGGYRWGTTVKKMMLAQEGVKTISK